MAGMGHVGSVGASAVAIPPHMPSSNFVFSHLSLDGSISLNSDGSASVKSYELAVAAGQELHLERVNFVILDGGSDPGDFGGINSLTTGCRMLIVDGANTVLQDFGTTTGAIKRNADFGLLAGIDVVADAAVGPNDDAVYVRWTITKAGHPMRLRAGEKVVFEVRDDLTELSDFMAIVQGVTITPGL